MLYEYVWLTNNLLVCKTKPEWDGEVPWKVNFGQMIITEVAPIVGGRNS